jgi:hypothetical protein
MNNERRRNPRLNDSLPVIVRSVNRRRKPYQFNSITRDIGAGGLCAIAPELLQPGEKINLHIRFAVAGSNPTQAPGASARAIVLRAEERPDGTCIFAASFLLRHDY